MAIVQTSQNKMTLIIGGFRHTAKCLAVSGNNQ